MDTPPPTNKRRPLFIVRCWRFVIYHLKRLRHFIALQYHRLTQLQDPPHAIAGGVAIGIFIGFMPPLLPAKTLLAIGLAWLFRSSKVSAAIAVTGHDILLPVWPVILRWEYLIGYWLLHHRMPLKDAHHRKLDLVHLLNWRSWSEWVHDRMNLQFFERVTGPMLIGWIIIGIPCAAICYKLTLDIILRTRAALERKRAQKEFEENGGPQI